MLIASFVSTQLTLLPITLDSSVPYTLLVPDDCRDRGRVGCLWVADALGGRPMLGAAFFGD